LILECPPFGGDTFDFSLILFDFRISPGSFVFVFEVEHTTMK